VADPQHRAAGSAGAAVRVHVPGFKEAEIPGVRIQGTRRQGTRFKAQDFRMELTQ